MRLGRAQSRGWGRGRRFGTPRIVLDPCHVARCRGVEKIGKTIAKEENRVRVGMGGALMSIGKRNKKLNAAAIKLAKVIGPIHFSDAASLPFWR